MHKWSFFKVIDIFYKQTSSFRFISKSINNNSFLTVPQVGMQSVIVAFSGHTHFYCFSGSSGDQWSQLNCGKIAQLGRKCHNYIPTHACIRICPVCEDGKDKSVPRITKWPHEACRVMTISDHKGRI